MSGPGSCFDLRLRMVGSHDRKSSGKFGKCVKSSSRTRLSKISPTHSRSDHIAAIVLLTLSAAVAQTLLSAQAAQARVPVPQTTALKAIPTADEKIVRRWSLSGDPHGLALGSDGTVYVGLALPQAVIAIDPASGA